MIEPMDGHAPKLRELPHEPERQRQDKDKESLDNVIDELTKPVEMITIYLSRPIRRRTGQAALLAVQELVSQLTRAGLPVQGLHSGSANRMANGGSSRCGKLVEEGIPEVSMCSVVLPPPLGRLYDTRLSRTVEGKGDGRKEES